MSTRTTILAFVLASSLGGGLVACGATVADSSATATAAQIDSLRQRWNVAAKQVDGAFTAGISLDFTWKPDAFPAPTFRGGSSTAYEKYAEILVLFYETGDNLEFATSNGLLVLPFGDGLDAAHGGTTYTLRGMTAALTSSLSSLVQPATVAKLEAFCPTVGCAAAASH